MTHLKDFVGQGEIVKSRRHISRTLLWSDCAMASEMIHSFKD